MEINLHAFLIFVLDEVDWSTFLSGRSSLVEYPALTGWGALRPELVLDVVVKRGIQSLSILQTVTFITEVSRLSNVYTF